MRVKLWEVEFGTWTKKVVNAPNPKCAMQIAMKQRRKEGDTYLNRIQNITKVDFIAEED